MAKRKLTISVDEAVWEEAHRTRDHTGRSISHVCEQALKAWIAEFAPARSQTPDLSDVITSGAPIDVHRV